MAQNGKYQLSGLAKQLSLITDVKISLQIQVQNESHVDLLSHHVKKKIESNRCSSTSYKQYLLKSRDSDLNVSFLKDYFTDLRCGKQHSNSTSCCHWITQILLTAQKVELIISCAKRVWSPDRATVKKNVTLAHFLTRLQWQYSRQMQHNANMVQPVFTY